MHAEEVVCCSPATIPLGSLWRDAAVRAEEANYLQLSGDWAAGAVLWRRVLSGSRRDRVQLFCRRPPWHGGMAPAVLAWTRRHRFEVHTALESGAQSSFCDAVRAANKVASMHLTASGTPSLRVWRNLAVGIGSVQGIIGSALCSTGTLGDVHSQFASIQPVRDM